MHKLRTLPVDTRRALVERSHTGVTLDGARAVVSGWRNDFATVTALPDGPNVEFAWETVARVLNRDGAFKS